MPGLFACILAAIAAGPAPKDVSLLVWGGLRGNPNPALLSWVDSLRREASGRKRPCLAVDAGEAFFGSDLSHATRGGAMARILNLAQPDALLLGGNDFFWTRARMDTILADLRFPVVTTNLVNALDEAPYGRAESILRDFDGFKVGLVGVVESDLASSDRPVRFQDLRSEEPGDRVGEAIGNLRTRGASAVVVVSRAGLEADEEMARSISGIDLIVGYGGCERDTLERVGKVWISRLAPKAGATARIDLSLRDSGNSVEVSVPAAPADIRLPAAWKPVFDSIEKVERIRRDSTAGILPEAWPRSPREGMLGNFLADALRSETGADIAIWPAGGIRAGLPKGRVTVADLEKAIGPAAQVSIFELPGSEFRRMIKVQFSRPADFLFLSGASCTPDSSQFGGPGTQVMVDGKPVQGGEHYRIAIPQCLRDSLFELTSFSLESAAPQYLERWDRDLVVQYARRNGLKTSLGRVPPMYGSVR